MDICWKLYFQTVSNRTHCVLPRHLHLENILTNCVPFSLLLIFSLIALKMVFKSLKGVVDCFFFSRLDCVYGVQPYLC